MAIPLDNPSRRHRFVSIAASIAQSSEPGGLSTSAHVFIGVVALATVLFILALLRRRQLRSKYALLWTGAAVALAVLALFPGLLDAISVWVGIDYPPALLLLLATGFLFLVVIEFSREVSRLDERTRVLAEEIAILKADQGSQQPRT
jgi:hypothetical protein